MFFFIKSKGVKENNNPKEVKKKQKNKTLKGLMKSFHKAIVGKLKTLEICWACICKMLIFDSFES